MGGIRGDDDIRQRALERVDGEATGSDDGGGSESDGRDMFWSDPENGNCQDVEAVHT